MCLGSGLALLLLVIDRFGMTREGEEAGWLAGSLAIELPSHHVTNLASLIDGRSPLTRK